MRNQDFPIDWDEFEKRMLQQFPFLPKSFLRGDVTRNASWINDYVQKSVDAFLNGEFAPSNVNALFSGKLRYRLFETHRSIIARIRLPDSLSPHDVRTSVNPRCLRIILPNGKKQEIRLDKNVYPRKSRAQWKDGILEVRMPKAPEPKLFHDVHVQEW